jgi:hypothetical protein
MQKRVGWNLVGDFHGTLEIAAEIGKYGFQTGCARSKSINLSSNSMARGYSKVYMQSVLSSQLNVIFFPSATVPPGICPITSIVPAGLSGMPSGIKVSCIVLFHALRIDFLVKKPHNCVGKTLTWKVSPWMETTRRDIIPTRSTARGRAVAARQAHNLEVAGSSPAPAT